MTWHPERIGGDVERELARFGSAGAIRDVVRAWPGAVGEAIAANAWPARLARDGTLHVAVSSSVWAAELTQLEAMVRERLSEALGKRAPARLRFAVGRLPDRRAADVKSHARPVTEVSAGERAAGLEIAAGIEDDELRGVVARAAAASLARARARADDRSLW